MLCQFGRVNFNLQHFCQSLKHCQGCHRVLNFGGIGRYLTQQADAVDIPLFAYTQQQPVEAGDLQITPFRQAVLLQFLSPLRAGGYPPDPGLLGMMDAAESGGTGIYSLDQKFLSHVEDTVGQLVAIGGRLVIADKQDDVTVPTFVFPVVELALGKLRCLDHIVPDYYPDGVEEIGGFNLRQLFKPQLSLQVVGYDD